MLAYCLTFGISLILSLGLTPMLIDLAERFNLVDQPDARKVHKNPIPRVGGIAIFFASVITILPLLCLPNIIGITFRESVLQIVALLVGSLMMFCLGLYDDIVRARVRTKLAVQLIAAIVVCASGVRIESISLGDMHTIPLESWGCILTILWIVGITNAINLIDGLDGLAAGIVSIACSFIAILSMWQGNVILALIMLAIIGSLGGFLVFNFHPAKIFMGDCGSLFIGFIIATSSVLTASKAETLVGIGIPILVLGIPIFDTLFSILRRFLNRRGIMSPDRGHFHHRLIDLGFHQHHVAIIAYVITLVVSGLGMFMLVSRSTLSIWILTSCLLLFILIFRCIGAIRIREILESIQKRNTINQKQRNEKKIFEEASLSFRGVQTLEQWWERLCMAADALDISQLSLKSCMPGHQLNNLYQWGKHEYSSQSFHEQIHIHLPIRDKDHNVSHVIELDIEPNGSIENAGHRATLFARLTEEHSLESLSLS